jgi:hypothetical protein
MMLATCQNNPDDKIKFMLKWLEDTYGERATRGDKGTMQQMEAEANRLQALLDAQKEKTAGTTDDEKPEDRGSEHHSDSSVSKMIL